MSDHPTPPQQPPPLEEVLAKLCREVRRTQRTADRFSIRTQLTATIAGQPAQFGLDIEWGRDQ